MTMPGSSAPAALADQWPVATPAAVGLADAPLEAMTSAIQAGHFKKINSVLIARRGSLSMKRTSMASSVKPDEHALGDQDGHQYAHRYRH